MLFRGLNLNQIANELLLLQVEADVQGVGPVQPLGSVQRGDWQCGQEGRHQALDVSACKLGGEEGSLQDESAEASHHFHQVFSWHLLNGNRVAD